MMRRYNKGVIPIWEANLELPAISATLTWINGGRHRTDTLALC
jgi:hypothetical protein